MPDLTVFFIIVGMSAFQYFMASRNSFILGAVVPLLFTALVTWMFITSRIESKIAYSVLLVIGLIILIEEWARGRKSFRKRQQKEMEIMITKDL
ncbi:hypothetical protein [Paenibacillus lentus]|uniref:EamA domain-containing protein n=1 Tax=Paenibacillus lentus TaxID=1338368 RepID=A0A3S8RZX7_9BACL|nr:hypothetical protein [Paenibacillus lentus]AZK48465.1 hypothetical protein EIM92_21695 [Paenibacillus lentus]